MLANPFAGVKVRDATRTRVLNVSHASPEGEWALVRTIADVLEWSFGWSVAAAPALPAGFRACNRPASELIGATQGHVETDPRGDHWLRVTGKG